jgi:DNA-binding MarR family transcriptional regulator
LEVHIVSDILSLESRKRIYAFVEEHSGSHLREISRRCELPLGTALYHLDRLESEGLLTVRRDGRYKRYFPAQGLGRKEKDLLSAFRHEVPRRIGASLLEVGMATQRELCTRVGVSRSTLSFHVNSLIGRGILRREPWRPENRYALEDPDLAQQILTKYRDSLGDTSPLRVIPLQGPPALPAPLPPPTAPSQPPLAATGGA